MEIYLLDNKLILENLRWLHSVKTSSFKEQLANLQFSWVNIVKYLVLFTFNSVQFNVNFTVYVPQMHAEGCSFTRCCFSARLNKNT